MVTAPEAMSIVSTRLLSHAADVAAEIPCAAASSRAFSATKQDLKDIHRVEEGGTRSFMGSANGNGDHGPGGKRSDTGFVSLLTEHQILIRNFVASLVPAVDVRADIVQEINILLWEKRGSFELGTNFKAWAFAVARYVVMNNQKRFRRDGHLIFSSEVVEALADRLDLLDSKPDERIEALRECMKNLREEDQQLLLDCHEERGSIERAAKERSQPAATIRSILLRLRRRLLRCIRSRLALARLAT